MKASFLRTSFCLFRMVLHLLKGLALAAIYPFVSPPSQRRMKQGWSHRLLGVFAVRLDITGEAVVPGALIVANHISWLDVYAINAVQPAAFVAKAEVRQWPLIGWLAARSETIFLRRGSRGHARAINAEIANVLDGGRNVAVFPEGTTTDGTHLLHFHAALLQPALAAGHPVQPIAIAYRDAEGHRSLVPAYVGETTLLESMRTVASARGLSVEIWVGAPLSNDMAHRRELAVAARATIAARLGLAPD